MINLKLNIRAILTNKVDYLALVVLLRRLEVTKEAFHAVSDLNCPTNASEFRYSFGICNFFRSIVLDFAHISASLNQKLKKRELTGFPKMVEQKKQDVDTFK